MIPQIKQSAISVAQQWTLTVAPLIWQSAMKVAQ